MEEQHDHPARQADPHGGEDAYPERRETQVEEQVGADLVEEA
jgi:hypothetical protein